MKLIDELKDRRERQTKVLTDVFEAIKEREDYRLCVETEIDDLDLAIAALQQGEIEITVTNDEPAPVDAEPDALGEVEIPEGFTKWTKDSFTEERRGQPVELLFADGGKFETVFGGGQNGNLTDIIAYRIISEPAAGEGEALPDGGYQHVVDAEPQLTDEVLEAITELAEAKLAEQEAAFEVVGELRLRDGEVTFVDPDAPWPTPTGYVVVPTTAADTQPLPPLFPPEPPKPATPEQLEATGVIDGTSSWWARKLAKEPA